MISPSSLWAGEPDLSLEDFKSVGVNHGKTAIVLAGRGVFATCQIHAHGTAFIGNRVAAGSGHQAQRSVFFQSPASAVDNVFGLEFVSFFDRVNFDFNDI